MDLENILDELYELRPQDFTAARNARAAEARKAGERDLAERIKGLRRPTVSAWAGNLLVRREPERIQPLLGLGEGLRSAHRSLDGDRLRELSRQQHLLVAALAREARDLAAAEGQAVGEAALREIEGTLLAVLADPAAAEEWATGHLDRPLTPPVGFTAASADTGAVTSRVTPSGPAGTAQDAGPERRGEAKTAHRDRERRAERDEARRAEEEQARRTERDQARREAEAADEEARESEAEHARAAEESERADARAEEAAERVDALTEELKEARAQLRAAEKEAREARARARTADDAAGSARRRARQASQRAERLTSGRV
ncbi:hypothetical protein J7E88_19350 [Streptomyces sp. ISL-10]|uniref:hypothetical protein n=1 Tax=Streptomyces sp. ISL-10 TaxID=2819172 RepID=UPI001BE85474|nr:hypothetical protein [Streptomyces sp. ISL-10]MBT2367401.1 hypothetical protein [Streptomyces sp. ISL-10]